MKSTILLVPFLTSLLTLVAAHGPVRQLFVDGTRYRGNIPGRTNFDSPIRRISDVGPVKDVSSIHMNCGLGAEPAKVVAPARAGSTLTFDWAGGDDGPWPHSTGPILTYLASCENTTCDQFDPRNASWFKIDQAGLKEDRSGWFQAELMQRKTYSTTLPLDLIPGDYLVRHEIIGLHLAENIGGAEFYPSCTQLRISGNGTDTPQETVKFPGAYSASDPGILVNAFDRNLDYQFPGPAVDPKLHALNVSITEAAPRTNGLPVPTPVPTSAPISPPTNSETGTSTSTTGTATGFETAATTTTSGTTETASASTSTSGFTTVITGAPTTSVPVNTSAPAIATTETPAPNAPAESGAIGSPTVITLTQSGAATVTPAPAAKRAEVVLHNNKPRRMSRVMRELVQV